MILLWDVVRIIYWETEDWIERGIDVITEDGNTSVEDSVKCAKFSVMGVEFLVIGGCEVFWPTGIPVEFEGKMLVDDKTCESRILLGKVFVGLSDL